MIRQAYLDAATVATTLLAEPAVAAAWPAPSALARLSVGGLAAHLAGQITQVPPVLDAGSPQDPAVSLAEHFRRSTWTDGDLDSELNTGIRLSSEQAAAPGPAAVLARAGAALVELSTRLAAEPADRVIALPWGPWALTLDDYLVTRVLEVAVHCDDLAVSVGVTTPVLPAAALAPVLDVLCLMSVRRHGALAVLRAFSRAERAPRTVAGL